MPADIKIQITKDDFREIRDHLKQLSERDRNRISDAIITRDLQALNKEDRDGLKIIAIFAKITDQIRDRRLIMETLKLDANDIEYLIDAIAPPDGFLSLFNSITIPEDTDTPPPEAIPAPDATAAEQLDLFPDLPPDTPDTLTVNYNERRTNDEKTYISISKLTQVITQVIQKEITPIRVSAPTAKKEMLISVLLNDHTLPDSVKPITPISFFDRIVEDAIGNLFEQGLTKITPDMVYRQINGQSSEKTVAKSAAQKVDRSIKRLAHTWITLDYTEQMKAKNSDVKQAKIGDVILPAKNVYIQFANGTVKSGWFVKELPQIYKYSKQIKQIATIPTAILYTSQAARSTDEIITAKYYLIVQIERIRRKPDQKKILFDSLFEAIGDTTALNQREIKRRRIVAITAILEKFKAQNYIADYKITKQRGGKIDGVMIEVSPERT